MTDNELKYWVFLSYSQQDNGEQRADAQSGSGLAWGNWLHAALKNFSIPAEFISQVNGRGEIIPERIQPIFQDESERPDDATLSAEVRKTLEESRCLIVICSPRAAKSRHVNEAVRYFKQLGRSKNILPLVVAGEPNAGDGHKAGASPADECFVPALRHPVWPDGTLDTNRLAAKFVFVDARYGAEKREILANDHRNAEADLEIAKTQLIAELIGVGFNGLWSREQKKHFIDFAEARQQARAALIQVESAQRQLQEAQRQTREAQNQVLEKQNLPHDVHSQIETAQSQASEAQNQAREAQQQLQEFQIKASDTQSQLDEARARILAAESKFQEAQTQAQAARRHAEETQLELQVARNQPQSVPAEIQENQRQAQAARQQIQELQNQVQQAQAQVLAARSEAEVAQNQLREARRQVESAQQQLQEVNHQGQAVPVEIEEAQQLARNAQGQVENARNLASEAQGKVLTLEKKAREIQSELEAARDQTRSAEAKVLAGQHQVREAQSQIESAQNQARATQSKIQESENKIRQARRTTKIFALVTLLALLLASGAWWQRKFVGQALAKAAADETRESDLAAGELNQEQIRQALEKFGGAVPAANSNLEALSKRISLKEIPETLKSSAIILDDQPRLNFQTALLKNWMQKDLHGALDWIPALPNVMARNLALEQIVPALAVENATKTLALLNHLKPAASLKSYVLLFNHWATNDPGQAIQERQQLPDHDASNRILVAIMSAWVNQQPDAAVNWANALTDSKSKNQALETCVLELAKTDAPRALALAETLPEGDWRTRLTVKSFNVWSERDLPAATIACQQLPESVAKTKVWAKVLSRKTNADPVAASEDIKNLLPGDERTQAIAQLCQRWQSTNILTWAQSLPTEPERVATISQIAISWAQTNAPAARLLAEQHPELSDAALARITDALAKSDLTAATNWVASLPAGPKKDTALLALSETWVEADPQGMATYALTLPASAAQTQSLTAACKKLAIHELPGTLELLKSLADQSVRHQILESAGRSCDLTNVDEAAKYIAAMPAGDDQKAVMQGLLSVWTPDAPDRVVNWLNTFPETNAQPEAVAFALKTWAQTEPAAAAQWLAKSPAESGDEKIVSALLEGAVEQYPEFAGQWTKAITDETKRQKYQVQVARWWTKTDPSAATKWLDSLDLPEALKQLK